MNKSLLNVAFASILGLGFAGTASAITIDTFDTTQTVNDTTAADGAVSDGPIGIVTSDFDNRVLSVDTDSIGVGGNFMGTRINQAGSGVMTMFADDQVAGSVDVDYTSSAGVDFLAGGEDTITLVVTGSDFSTDLTITLTDSSGSTSVGTGTTPMLVTSDTEVDFTYDGAGSVFTGSADLTNITGVSFSYELGANTDLTIDLFSTTDRNPNPSVPEPSSIALIGLGLLGMRKLTSRKA